MAKKELKKVLKRSKSHISEIEDHIKKGNEILDKKQKSLVELDPKEEDKKEELNEFEMDFSANKSAVKQDKNETKKEAKKNAKSEETPK
jgi:hypothetical protein